MSIRKGWFWHQDQAPKTVDELLNIYFKSVGRNGVLLLNVPPDRSGRLDAQDVAVLRDFRQRLNALFADNLALRARITAEQVRGKDAAFAAGRAVDERQDTYWATDDSVTSATLELTWPEAQSFNIVCLREPVVLGQRIEKYRVDAWSETGWITIASGATIGNKKLDRCRRTQTTRLRIVLEKSRACPLLSEVGVYWDPKAGE